MKTSAQHAVLQKLVSELIRKVETERNTSDLMRTQPVATYLAIRLVKDLATRLYPKKNIGVYSSPHSSKTKELLKEKKKQVSWWEFCEWMVDILAFESVSATKELPLVACESEVFCAHGTGYSFDIEPTTRKPINGYVWDFCKLLHFNSPELLFVARVNRNEKASTDVHERLDQLQQTLADCAEEYKDLWYDRRIWVVLLPSSQESSQIRIGAAEAGSPLRFEPFDKK